MSAVIQLAELLTSLDRRGKTVIDLLCGEQPREPWRLYPGEYGIFDRRSRCQFYFHAHPEASHEAGHVHTVRFFPDHTAHIVGISLAEDGWPQSLFTVNLWAIGDAEERPERLKHFARHFRLDEHQDPADAIRFVNLIFRAFLTEIEALQDTKAVALAAYRARHPGRDPFEDRELEILSRIPIDVRAACAQVASIAGRLPEGWTGPMMRRESYGGETNGQSRAAHPRQRRAVPDPRIRHRQSWPHQPSEGLRGRLGRRPRLPRALVTVLQAAVGCLPARD